MAPETQFRRFLPIVQCIVAAAFGGFGLWQRSVILSQRAWGEQTWWETTARFHVWPWPYKFAVMLNTPAFLGGTLLAGRLSALGVRPSEIAEGGATLALVPLLWFWIGRRLDRRSGQADRLADSRVPWAVLIVFFLVCLGGALLPLGYVDFLPLGIALWTVAVPALVWLTRARTRKSPAR
jgi:hypothetical protein